AADQINAVARRHEEGFTSIALSVPEHTVVVYWHGRVPADVRAVLTQVRSRQVRVELRAAAYSADQLSQGISSLMAQRSQLVAAGVEVTTISPRTDGSGIDIGVSTSATQASAGISDVSAGQVAMLAEATAGVPLRVKSVTPAVRLSRLEDLPSH